MTHGARMRKAAGPSPRSQRADERSADSGGHAIRQSGTRSGAEQALAAYSGKEGRFGMGRRIEPPLSELGRNR